MNEELKQMADELMAKMTPLPEATDEPKRVMTSEERVSKLLSEPIRVEDFRTALINLLNEHAAEQREACANGIRLIGSGIKGVIYKGEAIDACLNAVEKSDE